jgi:hypothetical protein
MVLDTSGMLLAHNDPSIIRKRFDNAGTQKALEFRGDKPLIQELKLEVGREILDFSLPVLDR